MQAVHTAPQITFVEAEPDDLFAIVELIDAGAAKGARDTAEGIPEEERKERLRTLLAAIQTDPHQQFWTARMDTEIVGTFQLSVLPTLAYGGGWRGQLESVHVRTDRRGQGIGTAMMQFAFDLCRERQCTVVQLTSNKTRTGAHRFYERLGFEKSHEGFKRTL